MISIFIKSSDPELCYELKVQQKKGWVKIECECPANERKKLCKHKIAVIECDYSMLFDPSNKESMNKAQELIKQTPFPNVLNEIKEEEKVIKSAQKNIRNLKHKVERITREGGYE